MSTDLAGMQDIAGHGLLGLRREHPRPVKVPRTTAMTSRLGWKKSIWIGMYCGLDYLHSTASVRQCIGRLPCPRGAGKQE